MANVDAPNGFTPLRHLSGGVIRANAYKIASGDSGDALSIFTGDVVTMDTDGYVDIAGAGEAVLGVCAGFFYTNTAGEPVYAKYLPADTATQGSGDITIFVYDDPMIVFEVQHDGTGAFAGNAAGYDTVLTAGNTTTGRSKQELDTSSATTSGQWIQLGLIDRVGNAWGANARVEVVAHEHVFSGTSFTTLA